MLIPARENSKIGVGTRSSSGDNEFAFGIETNLSGTPTMDKLWEFISKSKEEERNDGAPPYKTVGSVVSHILAGNISRSLVLNDIDNWFFDNVLIPLIGKYNTEFPESHAAKFHKMTGSDHKIFSGNEKAPYVLESFWVNFMKQHEFNPVHNHTGLWSFNIFMKIPYDWKEQYELPHIKASNSPSAGNFEFLYTDILGDIKGYVYRLDPTCEGLMLFFPSEMRHLVYPFYNCEEERITISGNIAYDI